MRKEIKSLKDQIKEDKKKEKENEELYKKQQKDLTYLEERYRDICNKMGISATFKFFREEEGGEKKENHETPKIVKAKEKAYDTAQVRLLIFGK